MAKVDQNRIEDSIPLPERMRITNLQMHSFDELQDHDSNYFFPNITGDSTGHCGKFPDQ